MIVITKVGKIADVSIWKAKGKKNRDEKLYESVMIYIEWRKKRDCSKGRSSLQPIQCKPIQSNGPQHNYSKTFEGFCIQYTDGAPCTQSVQITQFLHN